MKRVVLDMTTACIKDSLSVHKSVEKNNTNSRKVVVVAYESWSFTRGSNIIIGWENFDVLDRWSLVKVGTVCCYL